MTTALDLRVGYEYLTRGSDGTDGTDGLDGAGVGAPGAPGADAADGIQGISPVAPAAAANGVDFVGPPSSLTPAAPVALPGINGIPGRSGYATSITLVNPTFAAGVYTANVVTIVPKLLLVSSATAPLTVSGITYNNLRRIVNANTAVTSTATFVLLVADL